jgi:hypothetical protein
MRSVTTAGRVEVRWEAEHDRQFFDLSMHGTLPRRHEVLRCIDVELPVRSGTLHGDGSRPCFDIEPRTVLLTPVVSHKNVLCFTCHSRHAMHGYRPS